MASISLNIWFARNMKLASITGNHAPSSIVQREFLMMIYLKSLICNIYHRHEKLFFSSFNLSIRALKRFVASLRDLEYIRKSISGNLFTNGKISFSISPCTANASSSNVSHNPLEWAAPRKVFLSRCIISQRTSSTKEELFTRNFFTTEGKA